MNIIDIGRDEISSAQLAAYYAHLERRRRLLIRRQISWTARKFQPEITALLEIRVAAAYREAALSYMRSV